MKFLCNIGKFVEQNAKIFQQYQKIFPYKIYSIFLGKKKSPHILYCQWLSRCWFLYWRHIWEGKLDVGFQWWVTPNKGWSLLHLQLQMGYGFIGSYMLGRSFLRLCYNDSYTCKHAERVYSLARAPTKLVDWTVFRIILNTV